MENNTVTKPMYSQILNKNKELNDRQIIMKKENTIIINAVNGATLEEYASALTNYTDASKIIYMSKISNNRVAILFKNRGDADNITKNHSTIVVKDTLTGIRPYIMPAHRLCIFAPPFISNEALLFELSKLQIKPLSNLNYISAGFKDPKFSHILSFRRQIYIEQAHQIIPDTLEINCDGELHKIHLNIDDTKCSHCNKFGHTIQNCRNLTSIVQNNTATNSNNMTNDMMKKPPINEQNKKDDNNVLVITKNINDTKEPSQDKIMKQNNNINDVEEMEVSMISSGKRPHSADSSPPSTKHTKKINTTQANKKLQVLEPTKTDGSTPIPIEIYLEPLKEIIENDPENYCTTYEILKTIVIKSVGNKDIGKLLEQHTIDPEEFINMLKLLYNDLEHKRIKTQFTKLIKAIKN